MDIMMVKKKRKAGAHSPRNKERPGPPWIRTIGVRVSEEYAAWLEDVAKHDRATVSGFIDRAIADRGKAIGFDRPPPERLP